MRIPVAYSTECDEVIGAELAYDYFWAGIIKDKRAFECPGDNCNLQVTCANLDKLLNDMKQKPHYRGGSREHDPECTFLKEIEIKEAELKESEESKEERAKKRDELPDKFEMTRPKAQKEKKTTANTPLLITEEQKKKTKSASYGNNGFKSSTHYSLRAFVTKYIKYKSQGLTSQRHINIKGYNFSYEKMFIEMTGQDISTLEKYPRIYYGEAYIDEKEHSAFTCSYKQPFTEEGENRKTSTYIPAENIQKAFTNTLSLKKFRRVSKKKPPTAWVFIYGIPELREVKGKRYYNFKIFNMDYFDLREDIKIE